VLIPGAPAQVARYRFPDLILGRMRVLLQEGDEGHQKTRGTEAALETMGFPETALDRVQLVRAFGEALNRCDFMTACLYGEHQARPDRFAFQQDRASPAYPVLAAYMRTG